MSRIDAKVNSFICKWLGLPRCFSAIGLYGWNSLHLPLKSITLRYRQEKVKLVMELRDSSDAAVKDMHARVVTRSNGKQRKKWKGR